MQTSQGTVLQSLRVVQQFLDQHTDRLAAVNQTGARKKLDDTINELTNHAATQTGSGTTLPHVSSMQLAFARIKETWEEAYLTDLSTRPLDSSSACPATGWPMQWRDTHSPNELTCR